MTETYIPQTVKVHLYRDDERTSLVTIVEITDLGTVADHGQTVASSDGLLGMLARKQLVEDGRYTQEEAGGFSIYVAR